MAIGAHDIALGDFFQYGSPRSSTLCQIAQVVALFLWIPVIELQNCEIANSAISAFGSSEILPQFLAISRTKTSVVCSCARFVRGRVAHVVRPRRFARANTTEVLANSALGVLQAEARQIQDIPASLAQLRVARGSGISHSTL